MKIVKASQGEPRLDATAASGESLQEIVSTLGHGMLLTGNIVCAGPVHIFGRVIGDIHASQLVICPAAKVEGKVIAPDTIVQGVFSGTIHGNTVKLLSTSVVDGEIFNKSLSIEEGAQFEGVARRLDKPVAPPSATQVEGEQPSPALSPHAAPAPEAVD